MCYENSYDYVSITFPDWLIKSSLILGLGFDLAGSQMNTMDMFAEVISRLQPRLNNNILNC